MFVLLANCDGHRAGVSTFCGDHCIAIVSRLRSSRLTFRRVVYLLLGVLHFASLRNSKSLRLQLMATTVVVCP